MRCFLPFTPLSCALLLSVPQHGTTNEPNPRERSFRPVVPVRQDVKGGSEQLRSQTIKLTIPAPALPEGTPVSPQVDAPAPPKALSEADHPPQPKTETSVSPAPTKAAPETPGGSMTPEAESAPEPKKKAEGPTLSQLRDEAHKLAEQKLNYVFGADDPDTGGLDCSSCVQLLLTKIGVKDVPRTSYDQYYWLKRKKLLDDVYGKGSSSKLLKKLSPGDLIFWGGTWKSGHRVSHVMLYMGYDPSSDKHYVFGARSKNTKGLTGAGVDIFELDTERGRLVAHGKVPGLVYE